MLARRNERNRSRPLARLHNERPAICAFSRRTRPGVVRAFPQTRKRFEESLQVRRYQKERMLVNEISVVVAFTSPFFHCNKPGCYHSNPGNRFVFLGFHEYRIWIPALWLLSYLATQAKPSTVI